MYYFILCLICDIACSYSYIYFSQIHISLICDNCPEFFISQMIIQNTTKKYSLKLHILILFFMQSYKRHFAIWIIDRPTPSPHKRGRNSRFDPRSFTDFRLYGFWYFIEVFGDRVALLSSVSILCVLLSE